MPVACVKKSYAGLTTTGVQPAIAAPTLFNSFAIQLKGASAAPTSWTLTLEGSLDGLNWTTIATHNAADGSTVWAIDKPSAFIRANLSALSLGSAVSVKVDLAASE